MTVLNFYTIDKINFNFLTHASVLNHAWLPKVPKVRFIIISWDESLFARIQIDHNLCVESGVRMFTAPCCVYMTLGMGKQTQKHDNPFAAFNEV